MKQVIKAFFFSLCLSVIGILLIVFTHSVFLKDTETRDVGLIIQFFVAVGTISAVVVAVQPIHRESKLRKLQFEGGLQITMLPTGTINLINKTDQPIETISMAQKLFFSKPLVIPPTPPVQRIIDNGEDSLLPSDYYGNRPTLDALIQTARKFKQEARVTHRRYYEELLSDVKLLEFNDPILVSNILTLSPGEEISWPNSLAYSLKYGKAGCPFYFLYIEVKYRSLDEEKKSCTIKAIFRGSWYFEPEGWLKISSL